MRCLRLLARSLVLVAALTPGCAWVALTPDGAEVEVVANAEVMDCERLGTTKAKVLRKIWFVPRVQSAVDRELDTLARNEAVKLEGNTVTALPSRLEGEREYAVYRCDA